MSLTIPDLPSDVDTLTAALAYAAGGWYVVPVKRGTKHPGSVLGKGWHTQSSRDPKQIAAWFAGADHGVALHVGRSGGVVFDVDHPDEVPDVLQRTFREARPPLQNTRPADGRRGHVLFRQPTDRVVGNGNGQLGKTWGEIRGLNGVIVVAPSVHPDAEGQYSWRRTGPVPPIPQYVADLLPGPAAAAEDAVSDAAVETFLDRCTRQDRPALRGVPLERLTADVEAGASRHAAAVEVSCWAMREAAAGLYPARPVAEQLREVFVRAVSQPGKGAHQGAARSAAAAKAEWAGILSWAVAQALGDDPVARRAAIDARAPKSELAGLIAPTPDVVRSEVPPEGEPAAIESQIGDTWQAVDLTEVVAGILAGTITRHAPTVGLRTDGRGLFYAGKVNGIAGSSGCGKSWTALVACAQQIALGRHAVYVDLEDDAVGVIHRLVDLGADPDHILERFHYVHPDEQYGAFARAQLTALITTHAPTVVVIDSTGESMALDRAKPNDDDDTARWFRNLPTAIAALGPAVVVLDHVIKADEGGLWPIGSQRKRAAISGAQYMQSVTRPFSKTTAGAAKLVCAKDRHGNYRISEKVADLTVTPTNGGLVVDLKALEQCDADGPRVFRPTGIMENVSRALEASPEELSFRSVSDRVRGKEAHVRLALDLLVSEKHVDVRPGPRNSQLHRSARAYRQVDDPASDVYTPGDSQVPPDRVTVSPSIDGTGETDTHRRRETVGRQSGDSDLQATCTACSHPLWAPQSVASGLCAKCTPATTTAGARAAS